MQFVNLTDRKVYVKAVGMMVPGTRTPANVRSDRSLENAIDRIVTMCKDSVGIILNKRETELLNKLIELDAKGNGFDPRTVPEWIRNDPNGERRAHEKSLAAQQAELASIAKKNAANMAREAEINGEVIARKPVGPSTLQGEHVQPSMLKTGFERIMEENARIAAGKDPVSNAEILDPIGAHMAAGSHAPDVPAKGGESPIGKDPAPVKQAKHLREDGTRTADAEAPVPEVTEKATDMDLLAADTAAKLATLGPVDNKPAPRRGRRKAK